MSRIDSAGWIKPTSRWLVGVESDRSPAPHTPLHSFTVVVEASICGGASCHDSAAPWPGANEQDRLRNVEQSGIHVVLEQPGNAAMTAT
jgi:hypothetical protein